MQEVYDYFHSYMFSDIYVNPMAKGEEGKVEGMILKLFEYSTSNPNALPKEYRDVMEKEGSERAAVDYISGMTDSFAIETYERLFIPLAWSVK